MEQSELDPDGRPMYPYVGPPPPPSRRSNLTVWLIVGGALGLVALAVLGLGVFGFVSYLNSDHTGTRDKSAREPVVMTQVPGEGAPPKYGDTVVYDACSIVTVEKLTEIGVPLDKSYGIGHQRLDGDVPAAAAIAQSSDPISQCHYTPANKNSLFVQVHQAPFNSPEDLGRMRERGTRHGAVARVEDGVTVTQWQDVQYKSRHINVWTAGVLLDISFRTEKPAPFGTLDADTFAAKLVAAAKTGIQKGPTPPMRHVYSAHVKTLKDPCEIASKAAFQAAYPNHAGAASMVDGSYQPGSSRSLSTDSQFGSASCTRQNIVAQGSINEEQYRELRVAVTVWDEKRPADEENTDSCGPPRTPDEGDPVKVEPPVGSGKTCLADLTTDWRLKFQLDTANVDINGALADNPTSQERRAEFLPAAQEIARAGLFR